MANVKSPHVRPESKKCAGYVLYISYVALDKIET